MGTIHNTKTYNKHQKGTIYNTDHTIKNKMVQYTIQNIQ